MNAPFVTIYDKPPSSRTRYVWWRFVEQHLPVLVIYLLVATLIGVVLAPFVLVTVPSGYVGVLWKRFGGGTVLDPHKLKAEGMRITLPWNVVFLYDLRLQSATETYNAISRDGISLAATINIRFRLKREAVPQLHQSIGPNYIETLIEPEIGNRMREVIAEYTAEDVYSTKRAEVQDKIRQRAEAMMGEKMMSGGESEDQEENAPYRIPLYALLNLIDTLILGIELPKAVETAINRKIEQYYISEEYKFRVAREIQGIGTQEDRSRRDQRVPADRQQGHFRLLPALARHRGDASARTVFQFQDRDHGRQGWLADYPGQRRCLAIAATGIPGWKRRRCAQGEDDGCDSRNTIGENTG